MYTHIDMLSNLRAHPRCTASVIDAGPVTTDKQTNIRGALVVLSHTSDFKHPSAAKQPDPNRAFAITPPRKFDCFWPCALSPKRNVFFQFTCPFFCNVFVAEFYSLASKKYRKHAKTAVVPQKTPHVRWMGYGRKGKTHNNTN